MESNQYQDTQDYQEVSEIDQQFMITNLNEKSLADTDQDSDQEQEQQETENLKDVLQVQDNKTNYIIQNGTIPQRQFKITEKQLQQLINNHLVIGNQVYIRYRVNTSNKKKQDWEQLVDQDAIVEIQKQLTYEQYNMYTKKTVSNQMYKHFEQNTEQDGTKINVKYLILPSAIFLYNLQLLNGQMKLDKKAKHVFQGKYKLSAKLQQRPLQEQVVKNLYQLFVQETEKDGKITKVYSKRQSVVLLLNTGFGKTVISLIMIQKLKLKTLIVVPNKTLLEQWIQEIYQYIEIDNKGKKTHEFAYFQNAPKNSSISFIDSNKDIAIGIINSLCQDSNQFNQQYQDHFDFIIIDECHRLGAEQFCNLLNIRGQAQFLLGISATPDRQDKRHEMYYNYFDNLINVDIHEVYDFQFHFIGYKNNFTVQNDQKIKVSQKIIGNITQDLNRNKLLLEWILKCNEQKKYTIVVSLRIEQLEEISGVLDDLKIPHDKLYDKYNDIKKNYLLLASLSKCKEGLNLAYLNTIVNCTPPQGDRQGLKQLIGRILRKSGDNQNEQKTVIDIQDTVYKGKSLKRIGNYELIFRIKIDKNNSIFYDGQKVIDYDRYYDLFLRQ